MGMLRGALPKEQQDFLQQNGHTEHGLAEIIAAYAATQRHVGADRNQLIARPKGTREDDPEGWKAFDAKMGVPESPDGYVYEPPADHRREDGSSKYLEPAQQQEVMAAFHQRGMPADYARIALDVLHEQSAGLEARAAEAMEAEAANGLQELRKEWGGEYEARLNKARSLFDHLPEDAGAGDLREFLNDTGLGNDPRVIRAFSWLAGQFKEDGAGPNPPPSGGVDADGAKKRLDALYADEAYTKGDHPRHADVIKEIRRLSEVAYGS